jgi:hypothetical protein
MLGDLDALNTRWVTGVMVWVVYWVIHWKHRQLR